MVLLQRKHYFSKDPEGVQHFPGRWGGGGGGQLLISIGTHIHVIFYGGPIPPPSGSAHVIIP